jgi:hypothetical protein
MIAKAFFLAKIIHRIGVRNLRGKKGLRENLARPGTRAEQITHSRHDGDAVGRKAGKPAKA